MSAQTKKKKTYIDVFIYEWMRVEKSTQNLFLQNLNNILKPHYISNHRPLPPTIPLLAQFIQLTELLASQQTEA